MIIHSFCAFNVNFIPLIRPSIGKSFDPDEAGVELFDTRKMILPNVDEVCEVYSRVVGTGATGVVLTGFTNESGFRCEIPKIGLK